MSAPCFSDTFSIGKMLSFLDSLTPEQRIMYEQLGAPMGVSPPDFNAEETPPPSPPPPSETRWFLLESSRATETEVLLLATLLAISLCKEDLDEWLAAVEKDERTATLSDEWAPMSKGDWHPVHGVIQSRLDAALRQKIIVDGGGGAIETASQVLASWRVAGPTTVSPAAMTRVD